MISTYETKFISWWLTPAAAYRDGIISTPSYGISADSDIAYAIILSDVEEKGDSLDGTRIKFEPACRAASVVKACKTMASDTERVVRVLRSWRLLSRFAPKAGLRYDGL